MYHSSSRTATRIAIIKKKRHLGWIAACGDDRELGQQLDDRLPRPAAINRNPLGAAQPEELGGALAHDEDDEVLAARVQQHGDEPSWRVSRYRLGVFTATRGIYRNWRYL